MTTGRVLYQYHTGTMTHREEGIMSYVGEDFVEINPETAANAGIENGDYVRVESRHGTIRVTAQVTELTGNGHRVRPDALRRIGREHAHRRGEPRYGGANARVQGDERPTPAG